MNNDDVVHFVYFGGCRRHELYSLIADSIVDAYSSLIVNIPETGHDRLLTIVDENGMNYMYMIRKYKNMRPIRTLIITIFLEVRTKRNLILGNES